MEFSINLSIVIALSSIYVYINILPQSSTNACFTYYKLIQPQIDKIELPKDLNWNATNCSDPFFWLYFRCIFVVNERMDYNDSKRACHSMGATLLIPNYPHAIMSYLLRNHGVERFWFRKYQRLRFYYEDRTTLWTKEIMLDFLINSQPEECPVISRYSMGSELCEKKNGFICTLKISDIKESIGKTPENELIKHHPHEYFDFSRNPARFGEPDSANLTFDTKEDYYDYYDYYLGEDKKTISPDYPLYPDYTTTAEIEANLSITTVSMAPINKSVSVTSGVIINVTEAGKVVTKALTTKTTSQEMGSTPVTDKPKTIPPQVKTTKKPEENITEITSEITQEPSLFNMTIQTDSNFTIESTSMRESELTAKTTQDTDIGITVGNITYETSSVNESSINETTYTGTWISVENITTEMLFVNESESTFSSTTV